ncbi:hypothetical protein [Mycoplana ramosa]|uniref:Uncharacterized protein n=1 Tax=Mycoplana ramosa TaxID=40837 RepID=A0ABW3Z089_MYCRA
MDDRKPAEAHLAADLRAVVCAYVAANVAVAALLLSTVTLTPSAQAGWAVGTQEVAQR